MARDNFSGPKAKVRRAKSVLAELSAAIAAFISTQPAKMSAKYAEIEGRKVILFETAISGAPTDLGTIVGDVIHNLRSALDLAACEIVRLSGGSDKGVYFPFCADPTELETAIKQKNFHRANKQVLDLLRELQPYHGGNTALRAIHDLDIRDKHRELIPTLVSAGSPVIRLWDDDGTRNPTIVGDPNSPSSLKLVFPDDTALAGKDIPSSLHEFVEVVEKTISKFEALVDVSN